MSLTPAQFLESYNKHQNDFVRIDFENGRRNKSANVVYYSTYVRNPDTDAWVPAHLKVNKLKIFGCKAPSLRGDMKPSYTLTDSSVGTGESPVGKAILAFNAAWQAQVKNCWPDMGYKCHSIVQFDRKQGNSTVELENKLIRVKLRERSNTDASIRSSITVVNPDRTTRTTSITGSPFTCENVHIDLVSGSLIADVINFGTTIYSKEGYSNATESTNLYINKSSRLVALTEDELDDLLTEY